MYSQAKAVNRIKPDDNLLICDCGGGTIDITTYTIVEVDPALKFDELFVGVGGKCGSTYIDRNLHTFLANRFGKAFEDLPWVEKGPGGKLMMQFEGIKRDFGIHEDEDPVEVSPLRMRIEASEYYDPEEYIVTLTYKEMQGLFDPVIKEIINLISQQVEEARKKQKVIINRIILVGGFGESPYLNKVLAKWCQDHGQIILVCPEHPQSAVVRGAALRGLQGVTPRIRKVRRHLGIRLSLKFEGVDPEEDSYTDPWNDTKMCTSRMSWLIFKGDEISKDTTRTIDCRMPYTPGVATKSKITLLSSTLSEPQRYNTESGIEQVGSITSVFPPYFNYGASGKSKYNYKRKETLYKFSFQVQIRFGDKGENLTFRNLVNGEVVSTAAIEFDRH